MGDWSDIGSVVGEEQVPRSGQPGGVQAVAASRG